MAKKIHEAIKFPDFELICDNGIVACHKFALFDECEYVADLINFDPSCKSTTIPFKKEVVDEVVGKIYEHYLARVNLDEKEEKKLPKPVLSWELYSAFRALQAESFIDYTCYRKSCGYPMYNLAPTPVDYEEYCDNFMNFLANPFVKCSDKNLVNILIQDAYCKIVMLFMRKGIDQRIVAAKIKNIVFDHEILMMSLSELLHYILDQTIVVQYKETEMRVIKPGDNWRSHFSGVYYFIYLYCFWNGDRVGDMKKRVLSLLPNFGYMLCLQLGLPLEYRCESESNSFYDWYEKLFGADGVDSFLIDIKRKFVLCETFSIKFIAADRRAGGDRVNIIVNIMFRWGRSEYYLTLPREKYDKFELSRFETP